MKNITYTSFSLLILLALTQCGKKCEDINMPYIVQESYTEMVSKQITLDHQKSRIDVERISGFILLGELPQLKAKCTISNSSKYGGNFNLSAKIESQGQELSLSENFYIPANSTKECEITKEINSFSFQTGISISEWDVEAPTITVQVEETRYRNVTKYRMCNTCDLQCQSKLAAN